MRILMAHCAIVALVTTGVSGLTVTYADAETRVIAATDDTTWASNGEESTIDGLPLIVKELQIGDILDIQVPHGGHGFITIKQLDGKNDNQTLEPVLICGEDKAAKPNAVLHETQCGTGSNFGHNFTGSMKLEVLDTFTQDVNFWCTAHESLMQGTLKLKPKT